MPTRAETEHRIKAADRYARRYSDSARMERAMAQFVAALKAAAAADVASIARLTRLIRLR